MKSTAITAGQTGRIGQYNDLREDARAASYLLAHEQSTPGTTIKVEDGKVYFNNDLIEVSATSSPAFTAPTTNPRIDILGLQRPFTNEPWTDTQILQNTYQQFNNTGKAGQTFIPRKASPVLRTVTLMFDRGTFFAGGSTYIPDDWTWSVKLYATDGTGVATGSSLYTIASGTTGILQGVRTFTLATPYQLVKDTKYAIVFSIDTTNAGGSDFWVRLYYQNTDVYTDGDRLSAFGTKDTTSDLYFNLTYTFSDVAALVITQGTEAVSPVAPTIATNVFPICQVYNRVGQTTIRDNSTLAAGTNGYIIKDIRPYLHNPFKRRKGGRGLDGALSITSGTTTLNFTSLNVLLKEYTRVDITGTGTLGFSNPHDNGSIAWFKVQGDVNLTSTATRIIDLRLMGARGGAGYQSGNTTYSGGDGGRGGGAIHWEIGGSWNFPAGLSTYGIDTSGQNGTDYISSAAISGGGGGGAPGTMTATCDRIISDLGTYTQTAGNAGATKGGGNCTGSQAAGNGLNAYAMLGYLGAGLAGGGTAVSTVTQPLTNLNITGVLLISPGPGGGGGQANGCSAQTGGGGTVASPIKVLQTWDLTE